ncbi:MAG: DUF885 family protein [Erysipelotrichaceae bacterium]|nr:DUF885 family protein [Erysipelotrichaceae bacterium]
MKKLLILLLAVLLLTGCQGKAKNTEDPAEGETYLTAIKEWTPRDKNPENTANDPAFEAFLDEHFKTMAEKDYLSMHFNVTDYKALGLTKPEVTLGKIEYGPEAEEYKKNYQECLDTLEKLKEFDFSKLSYRQQYDYEVIEYSMYEGLIDLIYGKYNLLFPESELPSNLVTNFTEYYFYDQESLDDYLVLLEDVGRYMDEAIAYTQAQAKEGIAMSDTQLADSLEYIERFTSKVDDNELISVFNNRMDNEVTFLTDAQKTEYKEKNAQIVKNTVIPAYQKAAKEVEKLKGKARVSGDQRGMVHYSKGYAEAKFILRNSDNRSLDDVMKVLEDALYYVLSEDYMMSIYSDPNGIKEAQTVYNDPSAIEALGLDTDSKLNYLQEHLTAMYPESEKMSFIASPLDPSVASDSILAYYLTAPIDNLDRNVVRTNPNTLGDDLLGSYTTLAHEAFPGHLYQNVYYWRTNPHAFRSCYGFTGYTEGWAMQAEMDAWNWAGLETQAAANYFGGDAVYGYILQTLIDIGVNYKGWNCKELKEYVNALDVGIQFDDSTAKSLYDAVADMPATISSYGYGLCAFMELRQQTQQRLGDSFDIIRYNEKAMQNGPVCFPILRKAMEEYK